MTSICCSCDEHYGGNALACAKSIAVGTKTPCSCDCHRAEPLPLHEELADLRLWKVTALKCMVAAWQHIPDWTGAPNPPAWWIAYSALIGKITGAKQ